MLFEHILEIAVPYITSFLELIGVSIIVVAATRSVFHFFKNGFNFGDDEVGFAFAKAMSLSLEFKLAAEIIKTVLIRNIDEFIILAAVAILRVILTFVLHWELTISGKEIENKNVNKINKLLNKQEDILNKQEDILNKQDDY
ncbi:MAG: DUF1622 domain-containing protein [Tissierellales bacterium]|nr:DUF1622 domain-containing protein [Tissierellales bacterium]